MLTLYFGGGGFSGIPYVNLDELIKHQNHTPDGEAKLRSLWPDKVERMKAYNAAELARAKVEAGKRFTEEFSKRSFLLDKISKDDSWKGGYMIVPFGPLTTQEIKDDQLSANGTMAPSVAASTDPDSR